MVNPATHAVPIFVFSLGDGRGLEGRQVILELRCRGCEHPPWRSSGQTCAPTRARRTATSEPRRRHDDCFGQAEVLQRLRENPPGLVLSLVPGEPTVTMHEFATFQHFHRYPQPLICT